MNYFVSKMNLVKKFIAVFAILLALSGGFLFLKPKLAAYLLTRELSSDEKVKEIVALKNQPLSPSTEVIFNNEKIEPLISESEIIAQIPTLSNFDQERILGAGDERWIEINLTQQRLYGWEGASLVHNYLISSGLWAKTPTGNYRVWTKLASTTMKGGNKALGTYYYLPNVPCTMYFYKGYGIHGTYWHNNFGHPMSHGCVNMKTPEACALFNWASVGTRVNVHY